ncbi:MAG: pyridoxamine 5'-phosphate oxidase family protein [Elusimicrobia bacterium]|nr:pyridoxamine 5'-phosphate oxidase family protein [Elusimicrobiota bacterium]
MPAKSPEETLHRFYDLIKGIRIAMLTTVNANGRLHSRPMATLNTEPTGDLWFFTREHTRKVDEIQKAHQVNLTYSEPEADRFVSAYGTAELVRDPAKARLLWRPYMKAWFPGGLDDPDLGLLRVTVEEAEYWDAPSGIMVKLAGFLKAVTAGRTYPPSEHENVPLGR